MIAYYELVENIYNHLIADTDINTCVIGNIDNIDTRKQTIFPLAHILIGTATPKGGTIDFNVTVTTMDIIDIRKGDQDFSWKGQDNKQNILNTMFAVLENLGRSLDKGDLQELGWELLGDPTAEPFEDQYENLLRGWSMTFNVSIPNTVQKCHDDDTAGLDDILDNILI